MQMEQPTTKVRDLGLAAALVSSGYELLDTERSAGGRADFVFAQTEGLVQTINEYWSGTLRVKARQFADDMKMLKSRIYAER